MIADVMTKAFSQTRFAYLCQSLGVILFGKEGNDESAKLFTRWVRRQEIIITVPNAYEIITRRCPHLLHMFVYKTWKW